MAQVLLVEPDISLAESYSKALQRHNHRVVVSSSAQTAIDASDQTRPDIVILELQLAVHNGIEFLYEFRSYPEWQNIPVVILSMVPPSEFSSNSVLWKELAVADYFYKPHTTLNQLIGSVQYLATAPA